MTAVRRFTSSVLDPYERGMEFGHRHTAEVSDTIGRYQELFDAFATEPPFDMGYWGDVAWRRIEELAPDLADEIRGIADGAGAPLASVAAMNARTELLAVVNPARGECSTVVSLPAGRAPLAVQTWDWYDGMSANWLHWTIPHPDGRVVETVTEYGIVGKIGVNNQGVGVLFNMLRHDLDGESEIGLPVHLLSRQILDTAATVEDAIQQAKAAPMSASTSLTVVEGSPRGGAAVLIELFPDGPGLVFPDDNGLLVRTNHFLSEAGRPGCRVPRIGPGSELRYAAIRRALANRPVPTSADEIVAAMTDHRDDGYGVCCHPDMATEPAILRHATLATVSVDTVNHRLEVMDGGPCSALVRTSARHRAPTF
jgi:isopenicillin-N N-acyltransferase-like protein